MESSVSVTKHLKLRIKVSQLKVCSAVDVCFQSMTTQSYKFIKLVLFIWIHH